MSGDIQCHRCGFIARLHSCYSCNDDATASLNDKSEKAARQVEHAQEIAMRFEAERDGAIARAEKAEAERHALMRAATWTALTPDAQWAVFCPPPPSFPHPRCLWRLAGEELWQTTSRTLFGTLDEAEAARLAAAPWFKGEVTQ